MIEGILQVDGIDGGSTALPWPVPLPQLAATIGEQRRIMLETIEYGINEPAYDALRLAAHIFAVVAGAISEMALAVAMERETRLRLVGFPEIEWLRRCDDELPVTVTPPVFNPPRSYILRRLARVASWTPWRKIPSAMVAPQATVVSHNELLCAVAKKASITLGFHHADAWLANRDVARRTDAGPALALCDVLSENLAQTLVVDEALTARARLLYAANLRPLVEYAWHDLTSLSRMRLPAQLWSGTGGSWAARALGIEIMRRGGIMRRFDHGGGTGFIADPLWYRLGELCVTTEFTTYTPAVASILARQVNGASRAAITGADGDPHFRLPLGRPRQSRRRPRVVYATTALHGMRRLVPLNLPDAVYVRWQICIARTLATMNIELVLKPHPEGLLRGRTQPLSKVKPIDIRPFEQVINEADVAVFDYPASTAFWAALCTYCPVVLLDTGLTPFEEETLPLIRERVTFVPVDFDTENRPQFSQSELEDAVLMPRVTDPAPFRQMLGGEYH